MSSDVRQYDEWLADDGDTAAVVLRQWFQPVEGEKAVVFPPTYAKPESVRDSDWSGYNIDRLPDGTTVCLMDSVGSQANRMETIFKREVYRDLVPQITIQVKENAVNLLDAGHRAADAVARFSSLAGELDEAFKAVQKGNAVPLARIAPTSIVFGAWDSRATQVKLPRVVRSVIRAYRVTPLHRSAQYIPPIDYIAEGVLALEDPQKHQQSLSELGLSHAPATWTHGGVQMADDDSIRRDASLNLSAVRALRADGRDEETLKLRRYILGLAMVGFTAPTDSSLREGCQLVPSHARKSEWETVQHDGTRKAWNATHAQVLEFARAAARDFGVADARTVDFDSRKATSEVTKSKQERKKAGRKGGTDAEPVE